MISILANPSKPQGAQKSVHYPAYLRFDPYFFQGSKWADESTDSDITLAVSAVVYGGASQNSGLTINTLMSSWGSWVNQFMNPLASRVVANNGYLRLVGDAWVNTYKSFRSIRYSPLKAISQISLSSSATVSNPIQIIELDSSRFVVLWRDGNAVLQATAGTIASDGTVTYGTNVTITSTSAVRSASDCGVLIATDKIAIASIHTSSYAHATVITVSGNTITVGTPVALNATASSNLSIAKLDTNKFIVGYNYSSSYKAIACTVSGTVPTAGVEATVKAGATARTVLAQLTTDKVVMSVGATTVAGIFCLSVSGTTITVGTEQAPPTAIAVQSICAYSTSKFMILTQENSNTRAPNMAIYSVSGTTITLLDKKKSLTQGTATTGTANFMKPYVFDTTKIAFFWQSEVATTQAALPYTLVIDVAGDVIAEKVNPAMAGLGEISISNNVFYIGDRQFYTLNGNNASAYCASLYGMVGSWGILISSTTLNTAGNGFVAVWKNSSTEIYYGASTGDTLIGTHTPTDPPFFLKTYVKDQALNASKAYIKLKNVTGESIGYDIYDLGFIVD